MHLDAGIVESPIQPAERRHRTVNHRRYVRFLGHVGGDCDCLPTSLADRLDRLLQVGLTPSADDDLDTRLCQYDRRGEPNAGARAGDGDDFVFQHVSVLR